MNVTGIVSGGPSGSGVGGIGRLPLVSSIFSSSSSASTSDPYLSEIVTAIRKPVYYPWYHAARNEVVRGVPDQYFALVTPLLAYWTLSLLFTLIDALELPFFERHRIHEPEEVKAKNRVTKKEVVVTVILQQVVQTFIGLLWLEQDDPSIGPFRDHGKDIDRYSIWIAKAALSVLGKTTGTRVVRQYGADLAAWLYWWGIPIAQFLFASFVLDGWQYFWHRYFHTNRFLYRHVHSWHHRLYVPYAYGALYNHPLEGFIMDTLSAGIAHSAAFMTTRQAILFFAISSAKTVDDHSGYALPFDPFQFLFANNADYHDIHHQIAGLKKNFSQPYFVHFDRFFGTKMTRAEYEAKRYAKKANGRTEESKVNGPNEISKVPTSKRPHMALKESNPRHDKQE